MYYFPQVLDIGLNRLETINAHTFYLSAKTVLVFLDHNCINSIEEEAFSKEQPTILDISYNYLPVLEETIFTVSKFPLLCTRIYCNSSISTPWKAKLVLRIMISYELVNLSIN